MALRNAFEGLALNSTLQAVRDSLAGTLATNVTDRAGRLLGRVSVDNLPAVQEVMGTVNVANLPVTQVADISDRVARALGYVRLGTAKQIAAGIEVAATPWGAQRVTPDWTTLFYDAFDGNAIDPVRWTILGTAPTVLDGTLSMPVASNTNSVIVTRDPVGQVWSGAWAVGSFLVKMGVQPATGLRRFWGFGTTEASPSVNGLMRNGAGFETDPATGALLAVHYLGGVRTVAATLTRPTDGEWHRYSVYYRASRTYWHVDDLTVPAASMGNVILGSQNQPVVIASTSSTVAGSPLFQVLAVGVGDTARNSTQLSDGVQPHRKLRIDENGAALVSSAGRRSAVASAPNTITFWTMSSIVVPANPTRLTLLIQNPTQTDVFVGYGAAPTVANGIRIPKNGAQLLETNYTGAIHGIAGGANAVCPYVEVSL